MKDFWKEPETKKTNKRKLLITIITIILIIIVAIIGLIYSRDKEFREWFDTSILRKEVNQDKLATIEIKEENAKVYAFNQYIGVLNKNEFKIYGNTAKEEEKLDIEIANPLYDSSGRYLAIAEDKGKKMYFIIDKDIAWKKTIEGKIEQIHVSKNGYVAVAIVDTTYKTMITVYNEKGELLFNRYLPTTRVSDISISNDNKYLAIAEIDTSGIVIESKIEVISIEKATTDAENSKISTYQIENNELITNIRYHSKDRLLCMTKDKIILFSLEGNKEELYNNKDTKTTFQTIELSDNVAIIEEVSADLFTANSNINIINVENKNSINYTAEAVTKDLYTYENIIAINLGTEIEFINTNGWLVKRYKAKQDITDVVMSNNIAGIVYRDKIEIINL